MSQRLGFAMMRYRQQLCRFSSSIPLPRAMPGPQRPRREEDEETPTRKHVRLRKRRTMAQLSQAAEKSDVPSARRRFRELRGLVESDGGQLSVVAANHLMKAYVRAAQWSQVESLFATMQQIGPAPDGKTFTLLADARRREALARGRPWHAVKAVERTLEEVAVAGIPRNVVLWSILISCFCRAGDLTRAQDTVQQMQLAGCRPNERTFTPMLQLCARRGDSQRLEQILGAMESHGLDTRTNKFALTCQVQSLCVRGELPAAWQVLQSFPPIDGQTAAWTIFLQHFAQHELAGDGAPALARTSDMPATSSVSLLSHMRERGVRPNVRTFTVLADTRAQLGDVEGVQAWIQAADDLGVRPDRHLWHTLIHAHAVRGDLSGARKALRAMEEQRNQNRAAFTPTVVSYNTLLKAAVVRGSWEDAVAIYARMKRQPQIQPNKVTYQLLLSLASRLRRVDDAEDLFSEAVRGMGHDSVFWTLRIQAHGRAGDVDRANGLLNEALELTSVRPSPHLFSVVLDAHLRQGLDVVSACDVLEKMHQHAVTPTAATYGVIVRALARAGDSEGALSVVHRMRSNGIDPDVRILNSLLYAQAQRHSVEGIARIWEAFPRYGVTPNAMSYHTKASTYARLGRVDDVHSILEEEMARDAGIPLSAVSFTILVDAYGKNLDPEGGRRMLQRMQHAGVPPLVHTYNALVDAYGKAGDLSGAQAVVDEMRANGIDPDSALFAVLVTNHARAKDRDGVLSVLRDMSQAGIVPDRIFAHTLVKSLGAVGDPAEAARALREMVEARGLEPYDKTWGALVHAHSRFGDVVGARRVMGKALAGGQGRVGDEHLPPAIVVSMYNTLMNVCAERGDAEGAFRVLDEMEALGLVPTRVTLNTLRKAEHRSRAETLQSEEDSGARRKRLLATLSRVAQRVKHTEKRRTAEAERCNGDDGQGQWDSAHREVLLDLLSP